MRAKAKSSLRMVSIRWSFSSACSARFFLYSTSSVGDVQAGMISGVEGGVIDMRGDLSISDDKGTPSTRASS